MSQTDQRPPEDAEARTERIHAAFAHAIPFLLWIFAMHMLGDPAGWKYAVRSGLCLIAFLWMKPWKRGGYSTLRIRNLPLAMGIGLFVFVAWVGMHTEWMTRHAPNLQDLYLRFAVLPWGRAPDAPSSFPYAPEVCGWPLSITRLLGSALVIGIIEEFFFRGFLYRWMQGKDFREVDPGRYDALSFFLIAVIFASAHREFLAGFVAGLAYGWLYLRTRDIWATALAHAVTNYVLGLYVLSEGAYLFWMAHAVTNDVPGLYVLSEGARLFW